MGFEREVEAEKVKWKEIYEFCKDKLKTLQELRKKFEELSSVDPIFEDVYLSLDDVITVLNEAIEWLEEAYGEYL